MAVLPFRTLFEQPTVAELAEEVESQQREESGGGVRQQVCRDLDEPKWKWNF